MNYKASVNLINKPGNLKAVASVTMNEEFAIKGIRVIEGEKGLFISMPSRKIGENYEDVCFPVTAKSRESLHDAVMKAYEQKLSQQEEQSNENTKGSKKSGNKNSQKQSDIPEENENNKQKQETQEEQTEAGSEMSM